MSRETRLRNAASSTTEMRLSSLPARMSRSTCRANSEGDGTSVAETHGDNTIQSIGKMLAFFIVITSCGGPGKLNPAHQSSLNATESTVAAAQCFAKSSRKLRLLAKHRWDGHARVKFPRCLAKSITPVAAMGSCRRDTGRLRRCSITVRSIEIRNRSNWRRVFRRRFLCDDFKVAEIELFVLQHELGDGQVPAADGRPH